MSEEIVSAPAGEPGQELTEKVLVDVTKLTPKQVKALHGMQCGRDLD